MIATTARAQAKQTLTLLLLPVTLLLCFLFLIPLAIMVIYSFLEPGLYGGVVWAFYPYNYGRILGWPVGEFEEFDPIYIRIFFRSLRFALLTVIVSLVVCYPVAFWVSRISGMKKNLVLFLITLPFFANLLIRIYAWLLILRPTGFLNHSLMALGVIAAPIQLIFNDTAVIIGLVYVLVPFMFLPLYASVERLDPALLKASQDLGASPFQTFRRVIIPLTLPGIAAGSIIVFIPALGNFIVAELLGGAKVMMSGNLIEQQFLSARNWPFGAALAMLVMAVVLVLMLIYVTKVARRGSLGREVEV
jgi:spermidine/putrescine transport system permease protein